MSTLYDIESAVTEFKLVSQARLSASESLASETKLTEAQLVSSMDGKKRCV